MTIQAIIAAGGSGTRMGAYARLGAAKAFYPIAGRPALELTLSAMYNGGIRDVVLCVDRLDAQTDVMALAVHVGFDPRSVHLVHDRGHGVCGLPVVAERYLADSFVFDAAQSMLDAETYRALRFLDRRATLFASSSRQANISRPTLDVSTTSAVSVYGTPNHESIIAISLPFVLSRRHLQLIVNENYQQQPFIDAMLRSEDVDLFYSGESPEFDTPEEYVLASRRRSTAE